MLPVPVLLLLVASARPAAEAALGHNLGAVGAASVTKPVWPAWVDELTNAMRKHGDPLLAAKDVDALQVLLERTIRDREFLSHYCTMIGSFDTTLTSVWTMMTADDIDGKAVETWLVAQLSELPEVRATVRQGIAVTFEALQRFPVPSAGAVPSPDELQALLLADVERDETVRTLLKGAASGFAVGCLLMPGVDRPSVSASVAAEIIRLWFDSSRHTLALVDPTQAALDRAAQQFPEHLKNALLRVAYAWDTTLPNERALIVWLVVRDEAKNLPSVSGNVELMRPIAQNLPDLDPDVRFHLRLRLASEPA